MCRKVELRNCKSEVLIGGIYLQVLGEMGDARIEVFRPLAGYVVRYDEFAGLRSFQNRQHDVVHVNVSGAEDWATKYGTRTEASLLASLQITDAIPTHKGMPPAENGACTRSSVILITLEVG